MARHAEHWWPWVESGQMVIFGPALDSTGSWGLGDVVTGCSGSQAPGGFAGS